MKMSGNMVKSVWFVRTRLFVIGEPTTFIGKDPWPAIPEGLLKIMWQLLCTGSFRNPKVAHRENAMSHFSVSTADRTVGKKERSLPKQPQENTKRTSAGTSTRRNRNIDLTRCIGPDGVTVRDLAASFSPRRGACSRWLLTNCPMFPPIILM